MPTPSLKDLSKRYGMQTLPQPEDPVRPKIPKTPLNDYVPRPYQAPIVKALDKGFKRVVAILPRRAGKDVTALNYTIRKMWEKAGVYFYVLPTYAQGKKIIWDNITKCGKKFLDYFPPDLVLKKNNQEMKITMRTHDGRESLFCVLGSENYDSLVGTNPIGCVFSEYALQDPQAYNYLRPILVENKGWSLFISTPRGKNHLFKLYNLALESSDWFGYKLSLSDTRHIPASEIKKLRDEGLMSEDLIQQEFYCSFEMGVEGAYFNKYLENARLDNRVGQVPWESAFPVHTAWDIGVRDKTSIIFFQTIKNCVNIIDCYENSKVGVEHYAKHLEKKPYIYGKHIAPHDIAVKEWGGGVTRIEKARMFGINFVIAPNQALLDGIEAARSLFSRIYIDKGRCEKLLKSLENYRQKFDRKNQCYMPKPVHDWSSHFCFSWDTKIITNRGDIAIFEVTSDHKVLTLNGFHRCLGSKMTNSKASVVLVKFQDGHIVRCTPDHKFLIYDKLKRTKYRKAEDLSYGMKIASGMTDFVKVSSVMKYSKKVQTYCIHVPKMGHYALENGAIVHNCDAFRYMALGLSKTGNDLTPEELNKIFREAKGHSNDPNDPNNFFGI